MFWALLVLVSPAILVRNVAAIPARVSGDCVPSSINSGTNIFPGNFQIIGNQATNALAEVQVRPTMPLFSDSYHSPESDSELSPQVTIANNFAVTYYDTYKVCCWSYRSPCTQVACNQSIQYRGIPVCHAGGHEYPAERDICPVSVRYTAACCVSILCPSEVL